MNTDVVSKLETLLGEMTINNNLFNVKEHHKELIDDTIVYIEYLEESVGYLSMMLEDIRRTAGQALGVAE